MLECPKKVVKIILLRSNSKVYRETLTDMALENENMILENAKSGNSEAIALLIEHYQPDLKRFAYGVCQSSEDAEDAVQHTLLVIATKIRLFNRAAKFSSWLFTILKNECLRFIRKRKGQVEIDDSLSDNSNGIDDSLSEAELFKRVQLAITKLEKNYREVFILRDIEGMSAYEVSQRLGISITAVKSRLHRARTQVRVNLQDSTGTFEKAS